MAAVEVPRRSRRASQRRLERGGFVAGSWALSVECESEISRQ